MGDTPLVSFIVPVYNVKQFLPECINSIINQTIPDWELILVDDGSTDGSSGICDTYANQNDKIRTVHQRNAGVSTARNVGIDMAKGNWICFIDSDDYVSPDLIETLNPAMKKNYDVIFFAFIRKTQKHERAQVIHKSFEVDFEDEEFLSGLWCSGCQSKYPKELFYVCLGIGGKVFRRELIQCHGLKFDARLSNGEDQVFNLNIFKFAGKGYYTGKALYYYRLVENSLSNTIGEKSAIRLQNAISELQKILQGPEASAKEKEAFMHYLIVQLAYMAMWYFCNPQCSLKYKERKQRFLGLLNKEPYKTAIKTVEVKNFEGMQKKILCYLVKNKYFFSLNLLIRVKSVMRVHT